jgi:3',5'-cyclic AMP phosphodiesterase CpdA
MKLAHLSDLHFGRRVEPAKLDALRTDIAGLAPDLVVCTGDITDHGGIAQFRSAKDFLQSLKIPFLCVPGNREISAAAPWEWLFPRWAMRRYGRFFGQKDRIVYVSHEHRVVLFGLNSVHPFPSWPGKIDRDSRYWFKQRTADFPGYFKGLFLHHPVLPVVRSSSFWAHFLSDAGELLNICTENGVTLILQGHKHRASVAELYLPERNAAVVVSSCGAPLMPYWDSAYQVIEIEPDSISVEPREFEDGAFRGNGRYEFALNRGNYDAPVKKRDRILS